MKKELDIFLTAVMFFTRVPVPKRIDHGAELLGKSARYFPWVGILVGTVAGASYLLIADIFSHPIAVLASMIISIFLTGAFHEDGFADVCDGFGGGWTKEKILAIMKDSRLGTYGVIGLISMLSFKFMLLLDLSLSLSNVNMFLLIVSAHAVSRFTAVTIIQQLNYVTEDALSKSRPLANRKLLPFEILVASTGGMLPLLLMNIKFLLALIMIVVTRLYLGYYFKKWIGGYTGDCLGAMQQVAEASFYLGILIVWKFI
jgi:adenosylcobinamide-GDP ribazoletransferase